MSNQGRESWSRCSPGPPPPQVNFAGAADVASGPRRGSGGQGCASVPAIAALLWFQAACDLQGQAGCRRGNCLCLWGLPRPPRGRRGWCQQRGYTGPGNSLPQRHGVRRGLQMGLWGCAFGCRPPGGEGRCTCRRGPCVTLGSCSCCGFWCWQWVALSTSSGLAAGCVPSGLPGALSLSLLCSECTSPSSPPVMVTGPAALTGPSTGQPTATALGRPPPGLAMPAALAGRGPAGTPWPVEQQYASHRARMGGAVSSQAAVTALQDGRATPARQKLQLVLAPLHSMASRALEHGLPDPSSLLTHSFQQLDRIDSLSEQISFLEEQLGSCSCKKQP
uniref:EGF like domain multiple 7 n=1 Tax=Canis lupus familiaris TaxID=9615 RepID=A0A8C0SQT2_CANLF